MTQPFSETTLLAELTLAQGIRGLGPSSGGYSGTQVASAGDINGDGYADVMVSSSGLGRSGRPGGGLVHVILGKPAGFADLDLGNLGANGFRIEGAASSDHLGIALAPLGDINGDGFDDILLGASSADNNGRINSGSSYVIFGKAGGFANIDLANLGAAGVRIDGVARDDASGGTVAGAGDVNGDGYADLLIGASWADNNARGNSGSAYLVYGGAALPARLDLATLGSAGVRIDGAASGDLSGRVGAGGDVNGDGFSDIVVAAGNADNNGRSQSGSAYVILGSAALAPRIDLASLGAAGFRIDGATEFDSTGSDVAIVGDTDGDGFAEIVVGAEFATDSPAEGSAYVIRGHAGGFATVDLANPGAAAFRLRGPEAGNRTGNAVDAAGDVDGDGLADIIIGASYAGAPFNVHPSPGAVFVVLGRQGGADTILGDGTVTEMRMNSATANDFAGSSVAGAGDVDGDGFADILLASPNSSVFPLTNNGAAFLLFSQSTGDATLRGTTLADKLAGGAGQDTLTGGGRDDILQGRGGDDWLDGGTGRDAASYVNAAAAVSVSLRLQGEAQATGGAGSDTLMNFEDLIGSSNADVLEGDDAANRLAGGAGDDRLAGGDGADTLIGGAGDDTLDGGAGADSQAGGAGNDTYLVTELFDTVAESLGEGQDSVFVLVDGWTVSSAFLETTYLYGDGRSITGGAGDDTLPRTRKRVRGCSALMEMTSSGGRRAMMRSWAAQVVMFCGVSQVPTRCREEPGMTSWSAAQARTSSPMMRPAGATTRSSTSSPGRMSWTFAAAASPDRGPSVSSAAAATPP